MRRPSWRLLMLVLLVPLVAARCVGAASRGQEAVTWLPKAQRTVSEARIPSSYNRLQLGDDAARTRARTLVDEAPEVRPNTNEAMTLGQIIALHNFYTSVDMAAATITLRWQNADAVVVEVIDGSVQPGTALSTKFLNYLTSKTKAVLKDVTCDLTWKLMTIGERVAINTQLYDKGYTRAASNEVNGIEKMTEDAAVEAIRNAVIAEAGSLFRLRGAVDWGLYASGLYGKANDMVQDGNTRIPHPNGAVTRALVHYARLCLAPPR
jgi:hypothetical protein